MTAGAVDYWDGTCTELELWYQRLWQRRIWLLILITILIGQDSRSCRWLGRDLYRAGALVPTAIAASYLAFDFDYHYHFDWAGQQELSMAGTGQVPSWSSGTNGYSGTSQPATRNKISHNTSQLANSPPATRSTRHPFHPPPAIHPPATPQQSVPRCQLTL